MGKLLGLVHGWARYLVSWCHRLGWGHFGVLESKVSSIWTKSQVGAAYFLDGIICLGATVLANGHCEGPQKKTCYGLLLEGAMLCDSGCSELIRRSSATMQKARWLQTRGPRLV